MKVYEVPFNEAIDPEMQHWMPYLVSHASNNDGIVRFKVVFTDSDPLLRLWFVQKLTDPGKIRQLLAEPMFLVHYPDKTVKKVNNPFRFEGSERILEVK